MTAQGTIRMTFPTRAVLAALLADPESWQHGYRLRGATSPRLSGGTIYTMLHRMEGRGWVEARWEPSPTPGRPPRLLYRLTPDGVTAARTHTQEGP